MPLKILCIVWLGFYLMPNNATRHIAPTYHRDLFEVPTQIKPRFVKEVGNTTARVGESILLNCTIVRKRHAERVAWLFSNGTVISVGTIFMLEGYKSIAFDPSDYNIYPHTNETLRIMHDSHSFTERPPYIYQLYINKTRLEHQGCYICKVFYREFIDDQSRGCIGVIIPNGIVNGWSSSSHVIAKEFENAVLHCNASGSPLPEVTWKRADNKPIIMKSLDGFYPAYNIKTRNLLFWRVDRRQQGTYICIVSNGFTRPISKKIKLVVESTPQLRTRFVNLGVLIGGNVTLTCSVNANPEPVMYWESSVNDRLPHRDYSNITKVSEYNYLMKLYITNITFEDIGPHKCVAKTLAYSSETSRVIVLHNITWDEDVDLEENCVSNQMAPKIVFVFLISFILFIA